MTGAPNRVRWGYAVPASTPQARLSHPRALRRTTLLAAAAVSVAVLVPTTAAVSAPARPVARPSVATVADVGDSLRVLDRLHRFGYVVDSPQRADRAIRHWQRANGLTVDGVVGPETLASLDLVSLTGVAPATATATAERKSPPSPAADPEQIIRAAWPDELEDRAVATAFRESRLVPTARNACCLGLFQIHWAAHRTWLAGIGVTAAGELLDPATNAAAAFALYQLDGWQPWTLG